jgi:hypothetical protein
VHSTLRNATTPYTELANYSTKILLTTIPSSLLNPIK